MGVGAKAGTCTMTSKPPCGNGQGLAEFTLSLPRIMPSLGTIHWHHLVKGVAGKAEMNLFNSFDRDEATVVGFGIGALLISDNGQETVLCQRLAGLGCRVEMCEDIYSALDRVVDGGEVFDLIVVDCDTAGGIALGQRANALLRASGRCVPMILISRDCTQQSFPTSRHEPTVLRAPHSAVALRVGFEHAMQERLLIARAS